MPINPLRPRYVHYMHNIRWYVHVARQHRYREIGYREKHIRPLLVEEPDASRIQSSYIRS